MRSHILDTGISVAYEPENGSPVVDIIIVHGLQGHPCKTWTCHVKATDTLERPATSQSVDGKEGRRSVFRRVATHLGRKSSKAAPQAETELTSTKLAKDHDAQFTSVFWPADLLPKECPNSRILMFGYDSKITKYTAGAINQNSILSHSKDLLFALSRERTLDRPLICVAHSLGGIVVKEMLARSSASKETDLKNIVESTAAVVFLGTPHRGSLDVAALGEVVRSVVSTLGMETTPAILDALGLKTTDLERAQEEFSRLWQKYDFRVKTFQEGLNLAKLGKKVVPDYSSLIGDYREYAETLQANHLEMCRYFGIDDPNYRKVAGELHSIYHSIARLHTQKARQSRRTQRPASLLSASSIGKPPRAASCSQVDNACLESLWFPAINTRHRSLERPADQTCSWLFEHELYQDWFSDQNREKHYGLLWLKGKPGAGKSTLLKEAFRRAALAQTKSDYWTAAFFFSAKGGELEYSPLGLFRSLLYQLLPRHRDHLRLFQEIWDEKNFGRIDVEAKMAPWSEAELKYFFESMFTLPTWRRTIIFVDALDECDSRSVRTIAYFWRKITKSAHASGVGLSVCLSSRHFPSITLDRCPEIIVEQHNGHDIATYVDHRFQLGIATQEPKWETLRDDILEKSAGVFLWVVLVMDDVLGNWDDGKDMRYLTKRVKNVPEALETLFSDMFSSLSPEARGLSVRFFQWAILAAKPLRLHEWHHIMAFIRQPAPESLSQWRRSDNFTANDDQLERQIRSVSRGLVEVKKARADDLQDKGFEAMSIYAGAGSLNLEHGDTRIVQVIHESVRDFFLGSNGFSVLDPNLEYNPIGNGHLSIMATCLDYLNIAELDALVEARARAARRESSLLGRELLRGFTEVISSRSSSQGGRERYQSLIHEKMTRSPYGKPSAPAEREETNPVFEMLRSSESTSSMDILGWMAKNQPMSAGSLSVDGPACISPTPLSDANQSQVLEDHPTLLSYATFKLFSHARLAEEYGADPGPIVERLKDGTTWARWITLREDIPEGTEILAYAAHWGLSSWVRAISNDSDVPLRIPAIHRIPGVSIAQGIDKPTLSDGDVPPPLPPPRYLPVDIPIRPNPLDRLDPPLRIADSLEPDEIHSAANPFLSDYIETSLRFHTSSLSLNIRHSRERRDFGSGHPTLRRRGSVASFGSASSHNETEFKHQVHSTPIRLNPVTTTTNPQDGSYACNVVGCTAPPFPTQYLLNLHANVHSTARLYYCPIQRCPRSRGGKGFKRKIELIRHGLAHDSLGYVCPFCPNKERKYSRPDNLQRHVRVHHVEKDKDDPALREVLAQRPGGPNRSRRRRRPP